jgi:hypothetical protein
MKLYAEIPQLRLRQITADMALVGAVYRFARLGTGLHDVAARLAAPGRALQQAGERLSASGTDGGMAVDDIPLVGDALRRPFDGLTEAGGALSQAGMSQEDAVLTLALALGLLVALLPILYLMGRWAAWRTGWIAEASAADDLRSEPDNLRLFALRALTNRSLRELRRASPDPLRAYQAGEYRELGELELRSLGLQPRPELQD